MAENRAAAGPTVPDDVLLLLLVLFEMVVVAAAAATVVVWLLPVFIVFVVDADVFVFVWLEEADVTVLCDVNRPVQNMQLI